MFCEWALVTGGAYDLQFYIKQLFSNPIWKIVYFLQRKNGFFQKQPNFPCFSDLLKCNCKLISDVGFCLLHFDRSASSFFRRATHGLCQVQLLSWWPESIHRRRGNVLHYNMCLVNSGNAGSVVYTCIQTLNIFNT